MITSWVLILYIASAEGITSQSVQGFETRETCEWARTQAEQTLNSRERFWTIQASGVCVVKQ